MSQTLHSLFEAAAVRYPHRIAVVFDDGERILKRTYRQVQQDAQQIKDILRAVDVCGRVIGLYSPPTDMLPSLLLGILSSGAAFHYVDPHGSRYSLHGLKLLKVDYMIVGVEDLQEVDSFLRRGDIPVILSPNTFLLNYGYLILKLTSSKCDISSVHLDTREITAYCITTSGTTGVPKAVRVPHRCIVPNIIHLSEIFELNKDDLLFLASPLTFDPSVVEIFLALTSGASILITLPLFRTVPRKFVHMVTERHQVTVLQVTPTLISNLGTELIRSSLLSNTTKLRALVFGGEKCPSFGMLRRWRSDGNQTKLFNLYGTTEVSCWSTCYRISDIDVTSGDTSVPLGDPLLGTAVEVRDGQGTCVVEGEGELFIGSSSRVCAVGEEECLGRELGPKGLQVWRPTGDWVRRTTDGKLLYLGRINQQVKRHGMRLNLLAVEQVVSELDFVTSCAATVDKGRLLVFVTCARGVSSDLANLVSSVQDHVKASLPVQYHPDRVRLLTTLPLTKHGKVDKHALLRQTELCPLERMANLGWDDVRNMLECHWKEILAGEASELIEDSDKFIESGGDSFKAVNLATAIEHATGQVMSLLLDKILHETFQNVCDYVHHYLEITQESVSGKNGGRLPGDIGAKMDVKHSGATTTIPSSTTESGHVTHSFRKRRGPAEKGDNLTTSGKVCRHNIVSEGAERPVMMSLSRGTRTSYHLNENSCHTGNKRGVSAQMQHKQCQASTFATCPVSSVSAECKCKGDDLAKKPSFSLTLREIWGYNTGKCVDASPLVAVCSGRAENLVFIGSHSHLFSAVSMATGQAIWERKLGDRIESSACITSCGKFVVVGCYDHCVYFLHVKDGEVHFKFTTGGEVKSSPVADAQSSLVFIGSHDHHLYALSPEQRRCVWKCPVGGGSVFSSPALSTHPYQVIAASLAGTVLAVQPDTGTMLWQFRCSKPVFSSPLICHSGVCFGAVDGKVYFLSHQGELLWTFLTSAPIFSSPTLCQVSRDEDETGQVVLADVIGSWDVPADVICSQDEQADVIGSQDVQAVVIGSHDGHVYTLSCTGELMWKCFVGGAVYATPFVIPSQLWTGRTGHPHTYSNDGCRYLLCDKQTRLSAQVRPDRCCNCGLSASSKECVCRSKENQTHVGGIGDIAVPGGPTGRGIKNAEKNMDKNDTLPGRCSKARRSDSGVKMNSIYNSTGASEKLTNAGKKGGTLMAMRTSQKDTSAERAPVFSKDSDVQVNGAWNVCAWASHQGLSSSACDKRLSTDHTSAQVMVVPNTTGCLNMIGCQTGQLIACYHLQGEAFSSPVVLDDFILIGCRDNNLYCLHIDG